MIEDAFCTEWKATPSFLFRSDRSRNGMEKKGNGTVRTWSPFKNGQSFGFFDVLNAIGRTIRQSPPSCGETSGLQGHTAIALMIVMKV